MARVKEAAAEAAHAVAERAADGAAAVAAAADAATTPSARVAESLSAGTGKSGALSPRRAARLPGPARFVLAVVLSFALSELGRSFVNHYSNNEVGSIAREITSQKELAVLAGWKLFGLALGWFGGYDGFDLAALALLSHGPTTFLTSVFYGIRALTAGAYLAVEVASASLPFLLLRGLSGAHSAARGTPNRDIVADRSIQVLTSLQAALAYSVVLFLAGRYLLPTNLVLYFQGIPTIQPAADATFLGLGGGGDPITITSQLLSLVCGLAARSFIFTPLVTTPQQTDEDQENAAFDPVHATLAQTVKWNLWGYTTRTKVSLARTAVAMLFSAVGTYLDTAVGIAGVEPQGAVVYAGVWVAAALVTGLSLRYVGSI